MTFGSKISSNPSVCGGEACVTGTRIPVHVVLGHLAGGDDIQTLIEHFPELRREDVLACLEYARYICTEKVIAG